VKYSMAETSDGTMIYEYGILNEDRLQAFL
jgi:hypothetical protein